MPRRAARVNMPRGLRALHVPASAIDVARLRSWSTALGLQELLERALAQADAD